MADINLKVGLLAPTKGGKTTLLATTLQEISTILRGNTYNAKFMAADQKTLDAIKRKLAEYRNVFRLEDPFAVPTLPGSIETEDYKFALSVPAGNSDGETMRLRLWFKDFPGGILGQTKFEDEVGPFLIDASAVIVPIATDFLMAWAATNGKADPILRAKNVAADFSLQASDILSILADWVTRRVKAGEHPYIAFVPIRCETYFNDNGGTRDDSKAVFKAVQECFVKPLYEQLDDHWKESAHVEIHAVDTYGIVELVSTVEIEGQLESTFQRRLTTTAKTGMFASKGSFALLTRLLNYEMDEMARGLGVERDVLDKEIRGRTALTNLFYTFFSGADVKKKRLAKLMSENDTLVKCIATFNALAPADPLRQRIVRDNGETLEAPSDSTENDGYAF